MTNLQEGRGATPLWVALLTITSAGTTLALACATPFSALAALAAGRLPARAGFALMGLAWAVSQAIGFCVLDYPRDPKTLTWGFAILTAAMVAMAAARWGDRAVAASGALMRQATAFGAGFLGYKATLLAWSLVLGGTHTAISPYWAARQFGREALILAGLVLLYRLLAAAGVPTPGRLRHA